MSLSVLMGLWRITQPTSGLRGVSELLRRVNFDLCGSPNLIFSAHIEADFEKFGHMTFRLQSTSALLLEAKFRFIDKSSHIANRPFRHFQQLPP